MDLVSCCDKYYLCAWNVERYTPKIHDWLLEFVKNENPDVLFLSETKNSCEKLKNKLSQFENYHSLINSHSPSHYHGVAMLIRKDKRFEEQKVTLNIPTRTDNNSLDPTKGRIISIIFENKYNIIGTYVPHSGSDVKTDKYHYRINKWDPALQKLLNDYNEKLPTIWLGDINVALSDFDVSNPKGMKKFGGFTDNERSSFVDFLSHDQWIDAFRYQHPETRLYSWRGKKLGENHKYGMRLDNIIISKSLTNNIVETFMINDCPLSDHVPICATLSK